MADADAPADAAWTQDAPSPPDGAALADSATAVGGAADGTGTVDALPDAADDLWMADAATADGASGSELADALADAPDAATASDADADSTDPDVPLPPPATPGEVVFSGIKACPANAGPVGTFSEISASLGINHAIPQYFPATAEYPGEEMADGGGTAAADFDGDGKVDFYMATVLGPDRLYLSGGNGPTPYTGFDVPQGAGFNVGALAADLDHDGDQDVVVPGMPVRILRNNGIPPGGPPSFTDMAPKLLPPSPKVLPLLVASIADFDADGWADIYIRSNRNEYKEEGFPPKPAGSHILLRCTGPWKCSDVTSWLPVVPNAVGYAGTWFDADDDGDLDLYLVNDTDFTPQPGKFIRNDGWVAGKYVFTDASFGSGLDFLADSMAVAVGDFDRDGDLDLFTSAIDGASITSQNDGSVFSPISKKCGLNKSGYNAISWGAVFFDADLDGWQDLYVANGWLANVGMASGWNQPIEQPDALMHNQGDGTFVNIAASAGSALTAPNRSPVLFDLDDDGALDVVVGPIWGTPAVLHNGCDPDKGWLEVRLKGLKSEPAGIGARVTATVGGVKHVREIDCGSTGLWGSHQPMAHFGFGSGVTTIDELKVRWPSGKVQILTDVATRQIVWMTEP